MYLLIDVDSVYSGLFLSLFCILDLIHVLEKPTQWFYQGSTWKKKRRADLDLARARRRKGPLRQMDGQTEHLSRTSPKGTPRTTGNDVQKRVSLFSSVAQCQIDPTVHSSIL